MFNPLTPTVAIWVQLAIKHPVSDSVHHVKPGPLMVSL